jgi:hypothetical protein
MGKSCLTILYNTIIPDTLSNKNLDLDDIKRYYKIMIRIKVVRENRKIVSFSAEGHANYKKEGEDIVCAGVSSILQATVLGLKEHLGLSLDIRKEKGYISVKLNGLPNREASAVCETMMLGLYAIQKEYPDRIEIKEVR